MAVQHDALTHAKNFVNLVNWYCTDTKQWSEVKPGPSATWPCARHGHTVSTHEGSGYLYGGEDEQGKILGDFYLFSCHSHRWCKITTAGKPPPPLMGHSSVVFRNALYLFGGFDGNRFNNNIYKYDFGTYHFGARF
jgi:N-acetylneuraminic acid mutarotase